MPYTVKKHSSRLQQPALTSSPRSRPISLPCTSALPNCASARHLWIRPGQRIRSGDPAMKSVWSRCLLPAPPWPTPNGPITSRRSSASPATRSSASPRPACGREPARSPTSLPPSPCPPQPALTLSAAIGGSRTGCTMSRCQLPRGRQSDPLQPRHLRSPAILRRQHPPLQQRVQHEQRALSHRCRRSRCNALATALGERARTAAESVTINEHAKPKNATFLKATLDDKISDE